MAEPDPIDVHIGQAIRRGRQERRFSMERRAAAVGITHQQVQKYEIGTNRVSASMLYRIAECLSVPVGAFFPASGEEDLVATLSAERENLQASHALERIEDKNVRARLRGLMEVLGSRDG